MELKKLNLNHSAYLTTDAQGRTILCDGGTYDGQPCDVTYYVTNPHAELIEDMSDWIPREIWLIDDQRYL